MRRSHCRALAMDMDCHLRLCSAMVRAYMYSKRALPIVLLQKSLLVGGNASKTMDPLATALAVGYCSMTSLICCVKDLKNKSSFFFISAAISSAFNSASAFMSFELSRQASMVFPIRNEIEPKISSKDFETRLELRSIFSVVSERASRTFFIKFGIGRDAFSDMSREGKKPTTRYSVFVSRRRKRRKRVRF